MTSNTLAMSRRFTLWSVIACLLLNMLAALASFAQAGGTEMDLLNNTRALRVGDRMWFHVIEEREQPVRVFVNDRGFIEFPYIGEVHAVGKTMRQVAYDVKRLLEIDFFYRATVIVRMRDDGNIRGEFTILGEVGAPGKHKIPNDDILYVSGAVLASGGFSDSADGHSVTVVRKDPNDPDAEVRFIVDVQGILDTGKIEYDMPVQPDDLIVVPKLQIAGGQVYINGEVRRPGLYPIPQDQNFTVSRAILAAGGFTEYAKRNKVKLIRAGDELSPEERTLIIDCEKILDQNIRTFDPLVKPNDVILVEEKFW